MFGTINNFLNRFLPGRDTMPIRGALLPQSRPSLQAVGFNDFLHLDIPAREMLLSPILPERSLAMLYAPRGIGKSWLGLSIGLAVASGQSLLRWSAARQRSVLYIDGEMPLVSLQERLRAISLGSAMKLLMKDFGF
jgi:putative DNA primase/helicase